MRMQHGLPLRTDPRLRRGTPVLDGVLPRAVALVLLALVLAACAPGLPVSTTSPIPSPSVSAPAPTATQAPSATPIPVRHLQVKVYATDLLQAPSRTAAVVAVLPFRTALSTVTVPDDDGFVGVRTGEGVGGFVRVADLAPAASFLYAVVPEMTVTSAAPADTSPARFSHLVDVRKEAPGISVELLYAKEDNFLGHVIYDRDFCLMQESTLAKLKMAQELFQKDGYCIKIYDAYRPYACTVSMFAETPDAVYLADPKKGSAHNRGCAVDMTVVDADGNELLMPSRVDTLDSSASRTGPMSAAARRNLDYVQGIMVRCGFVPYVAEWWHYNDSDSTSYPHLDIAFRDLTIAEDATPPAISPPPVRDGRKTGYVSLSPTPAP